MPEIIIIGAGLTGLSCARFLKQPFLLLEKTGNPGGLCSSETRNGFVFDHSGHFLHMKDVRVKKLVASILKNNLTLIQRNAWIYTHQSTIPFPFQAHLSYLPDGLKKECLDGIRQRNGESLPASSSLYAWSMATFVSGITRYFMKPYNEKLWTVSSRVLRADWCAPFVPRPTIAEMTASATADSAKKFGYNAHFNYFKRGGCQSLINAFAASVPSIAYHTSPKKICAAKREMQLSNGKVLSYTSLVSTQPLYALIDHIADAPPAVRAARQRLRWNTVICYNVAVRKGTPNQPIAGGRHWVYFPEKKFPFYRVGVYSNIMPAMAPKGYASLYVEISHRPDDRVNEKTEIAAITRALYESRMLSVDDHIEFACASPIKCAYVIFDKSRTAAVSTIQSWLTANNIYSIGRYGAWEYSFMEKNIIDGMETAHTLNLCR